MTFWGQGTAQAKAALAQDIAEALNAEADPLLGVETEDVLSWWKMPAGWAPASGTDVPSGTENNTEHDIMARPRKHARARLDTSLHSDYAMPICMTDDELQDMYPETPLLLKWQDLAYTDGSYKRKQGNRAEDRGGSGAGVYIPHQGNSTAGGTLLQAGTKLVIRPGPDGYTNTITRAELVAILIFIRWAKGEHEHLGVATDSAAALHLISKAVRSPHSLTEHKHRGILWAIVEEIRERQQPLRMYKVKSHSGIVGNELADIIAKMGLADAGAEVLEEGAEPHLEDKHKYWLRYTPTDGGEDTQGRQTVVGDLKDQLSRICHQELRLGMADVSSKYYSAQREAAPDIQLDISNGWRTEAAVKPSTRRIAMAYHAGTLHCQAVAHRENRADTPHCILCGGHDCRQHTVSGCPAINGAVTERHHGAVRMIVKELIKGRHGSGVLMMDAGRLDKRLQDGIQVDTHLPDWMLPEGLSDTDRSNLRRTLKPDALLRIKRPKGRPDRIEIVEVKYCKDADRTTQEARAETQHARLTDMLQAAGYEVEQRTILLGVGGTIYRDTKGHLTELGVDKDRADVLLRRLSNYAVQQMQNIVRLKRAKETEALKAKGGADRWRRETKRKRDMG